MLKRNWGFLGVAMAALLFGSACQQAPPPGGGSVRVLTEKEWQAEVLDSAEPVLVDFSAVWCQPCQMMHPALETLAGEYKVCQVDYDANTSLASKYNVTRLPNLLIFKGGKIVDQYVGVTPEATLRNALKKAK